MRRYQNGRGERWAVLAGDGRKIAKVEGFEAAALSAVAELLKHKATGTVLVRERFHDEQGEPQRARVYAISIQQMPAAEPPDDGGAHRKRALSRAGRQGNPAGENLPSETVRAITRLGPGDGVEAYDIDGEAVDEEGLEEFLASGEVSREESAAIRQLAPGERYATRSRSMNPLDRHVIKRRR